MMQIHYDRITSLQRAMFAKYPENPEMRKFALSTVASIDDQENLAKHFKGLKTEMLYEIAEYLFLVPRGGGDKENEVDIKAKVNFSPMSPKLLLTYPHREEDRGIAMASLFLNLILLKVLKVLPNQLKIFVNLTFSPKV